MKHTRLLFLLFTFAPFLLHSQLKINELMSNNVSAVMDDAYNYSMWVELHNSETTRINLNQYYFTDDLDEAQKWQPSSRYISANGYAVLWFERDEISGHANFKLNPEGGTLYLMNNTGGIVDMITYPQQYRNVSYGRLTDGAGSWVFFSEYSNGSSNNGKAWSSRVCANPVFETKGGFYSTNISVKFADPTSDETIYYTTNGTEPTKNSIRYSQGSSIVLSSTTCLRACAFADNKLPSEVVTATYFVKERNFTLPVVSLVTDQKNLTDNTIGIYIVGRNGISGPCPVSTLAANYNQDWDRPTNFEFFDENGVLQLNQEIDMKIAGGCSRERAQKSLKFTARKKFGNNQLRYDFFPTSKPYQKYSGLLYRNSGNDFGSSMMRDGFMQTLIMKRLDIDTQAYLPTVCFINGEYRGIQNLRETSNHRNIYSNYGLDDEDIYLIDNKEIGVDPEFQRMVTYAKNNDINNAAVYAQVGEMLDIESFLDYMIAQIYFNNGDWPHHNIKMWKAIDGGKWRPILFDTDFGWGATGIPSNNSNSGNAILYALSETPKRQYGAENVYMLRRLMQNDGFKKKFIDRMCVQLSSTFEPSRANHILDSLKLRIEPEMTYHRNRYSGTSLSSAVSTMKSFSTNRPGTMMGYMRSYFGLGATRTVEISTNTPGASYKFFTENIIDSSITLQYFNGQQIQLTANPIEGYKFKHWELSGGSGITTAIPMGDTWQYWDKDRIPASNWYAVDYNDAAWSTGIAQFGWGNKGEKTTISYGNDANNKHITSYYRKTINIADVSKIQTPAIKLYVDDGAVIYVNGVEIGRYNMPEGAIAFDTKALVFNNGVTVDFEVPVSALVNGTNLIAVEVHQEKLTTSDAMFNLSFSYNEEAGDGSIIIENETYSTLLAENISIKAIYEESDEPIEPEEVLSIYINEIAPTNSIHRDEHGKKDDYIEIYNGGDQTVDIAGWYITDTPVVPTLYQFPDSEPDKTSIPAKGRIIVWADDEPEQGALHTNFSLSKDGEFVMLSKRDRKGNLQTIDIIGFPAMASNMTYSRYPDGGSDWVIQEMTFNASNTGSTGIEFVEPSSSSIVIYPAFVDEYFVVDGAAGENLRLFDLTGKILLQQKLSSASETVHLPALQQGMYIVRIGGESFKIMKK